MPRPLCSLSLDLDDMWTYLKTHGDAGWQEYPSYLATVVPPWVTEVMVRVWDWPGVRASVLA